MALIHLSIYSNEKITEVSTSTNISPYLRAFKITTNLSPLSSSYTHTHPHIKKPYTLSCIKRRNPHPKDSSPSPQIYTRKRLQQRQTTNNTRRSLLGRINHNLGLHVIPNQESISRQGDHNSTSTNLIDGFYTNLHNHTLLTSNTLINQNQNSDHYPVYLQLAPNNILIKSKRLPPNHPRITYPKPQSNIQNLLTMFLKNNNLTNTLQNNQHTLTRNGKKHKINSKKSSTH